MSRTPRTPVREAAPDLVKTMFAIMDRDGISTAEVARRAGLPKNTLQKIKRSVKRGPRVDTVERALRGMGYALFIGPLEGE